MASVRSTGGTNNTHPDPAEFKLVLDVAEGRQMLSGASRGLSGPMLDLLTAGDQDGPQGLETFLWDYEATDPDFVEVARASIARARADHEASVFSLGLVDTESFFAETYKLEYLVKGVIVKDQPCVFGGPQKTLKTSILIDLHISLASMTPFLGRFPVQHRRRSAFISGESGRGVIQANAKQICVERKLPYLEATGIMWGFRVPSLCNDEHLAIVAKTIRDEGIEVITFDPLYLTLLAGNHGIDPKDMFQMGPLLANVASMCQEAGATPILAHHFVKGRDDPFGPPEMGELAYAGIGQFMRQWMLTARRERYNAESGLHPLYFHYGGSAGHSGELHIDIETGVVDENFSGRKWRVNVLTPGESRVAKQEQQKAVMQRKEEEKLQAADARKDKQLQREADKVEAYLAKEGPKTKTTIRDEIPIAPARVGAVISLLLKNNRIRPAKVTIPCGSSTRETDGFGLAPVASANGSVRFFDPA